MPRKYNLTKYDVLANMIHKLSVKELGLNHGNADNATPEHADSYDDETLKAIAVLIASFSSNHSWQTYRYITIHESTGNSNAIKEEYSEAEKTRWKNVTQYDIGEVANTNLPDNVFSEWLFFNVVKDKHDTYRRAWRILKEQFSNQVEADLESKE